MPNPCGQKTGQTIIDRLSGIKAKRNPLLRMKSNQVKLAWEIALYAISKIHVPT
ncbi:MAG: hypothetical protein NC112_04225 [Oxalobacter formigenes]|nr:hypothetical protein [Oxalobacter formigenes]